MHRFLRFLLCSLFLLGGMSLSADELPAYYTAKSTVNVRVSPGVRSQKLYTVRKGCSVVVTETAADGVGRMWGYCEGTNGRKGWVCMSYMRYDGPLEKQHHSSSGRHSAAFWSSVLRCFLNFLGFGQSNVWWFYVCLILFIGSIKLSAVVEDRLWLYALLQVLAMVSIYCYFRLPGEHMWQFTWDEVGWLSLPGVYLYLVAGFILFWLCKSHLATITSFFDAPWTTLLLVLFGIGWGVVLIQFVVCFFVEHEFWAILVLFAMIPARHTPTIYVDGEGHITGHGYNGGSDFHGDNGHRYHYNGGEWSRRS